MPTLLIDTSAIYSLLDRSDPRHTAARGFYDHLPRDSHLLIIEYVLVETMTLLRARHLSHVSIEFRERLPSSKVFIMQHSSAELELSTFQIYRAYTDKEWSYTDCAILASARRMAIDQVFSFDHHLEQMGILRLPS